MPDTSCATWDTKEDYRMAEEWDRTQAGNPCQGIPQEEIDRVMPEVESAIHNDGVRCLENHAENAGENINQQLSQQSEITDLDKLDQEVWPDHQQLDEMVTIGEELGVDETEIIRTPLICGTPGVEDMNERIKDMMWALHTQDRIPPWYRDDKVFPKIMFVDARPWGDTGPKVAEVNLRTGVLHIYRKADGTFPTKEELRNEILPHEIAHASKEFRQRIWESRDKLIDVIRYEETLATALGKQPVAISPYVERLGEVAKKGEMSDEIRLIEEWIGEAVVKYVKEECSEITRKFFDGIFSEE